VSVFVCLASSQLPLSRKRRLARTAERVLDRQVKRVRKRAKVAKSREEGDLHRLRIALKKLRYSAEFFAPLYSRKKVARYLQKQALDPANLSATGFGEYKPVADNSTVEGRAKNRRIEIVLVPKD